MVKRTYSQRDKWRSSNERQSIADLNDSRKRHKVTDSDVLHLPTPPPSRGERTSSVLKKGLKMFGGPVSIPDDESQSDSTSKTSNGISRLFDKASSGKLKPAQLNLHGSIYGTWEDFAEAMKDGKKSSQTVAKSSKSYLPTPPAEAPKPHQKEYRDFPFAKPNAPAIKLGFRSQSTSTMSTETSRLFEKIIKEERPKQPYKPKDYQADKTLAPAYNDFG